MTLRRRHCRSCRRAGARARRKVTAVRVAGLRSDGDLRVDHRTRPRRVWRGVCPGVARLPGRSHAGTAPRVVAVRSSFEVPFASRRLVLDTIAIAMAIVPRGPFTSPTSPRSFRFRWRPSTSSPPSPGTIAMAMRSSRKSPSEPAVSCD